MAQADSRSTAKGIMIDGFQVAGGVPMVPPGNFYFSYNGPSPAALAAPTMKLSEAVDVALAVKSREGLRPNYFKGLRALLRRFSEDIGPEAPLSSITTAQIEAWFLQRNIAPVSEKSDRGRLMALFTLAERREWIIRNPMKGLGRIRLEFKTPQILTPEQAKSCLQWCQFHKPDFLASMALCLLAGVRPEEARKLCWKDIDLDQGIIRIDAGCSKVRQRRVVTLQPMAVTWLRYARDDRKSRLPLPFITYRRHLRRLQAHLGWETWHQDVLRHTCISYLVPIVQDLGRVALWCGNSPSIIARNYLALVDKKTAREFWSIMP